jgi:glycine cleavage system aminomethyltransferase T
MGEREGWHVPLGYTDLVAETAAARDGLALVDVTALERASAAAGSATFWLIGPRTDEVLPGLTALDVVALREGDCAETALASVHALLVRPSGLAVPSMRIVVGWDVAEYVWERLMESSGAKPLGHDGLRELLGH